MTKQRKHIAIEDCQSLDEIKIDELQHLLDQKDARIAELEEALRLTVGFCVDFRNHRDFRQHPEVGLLYAKTSTVLTSDGSSILKRVEAAEKVVEAARRIIEECWHEIANKSPSLGAMYELHESLAALDALAEKKEGDL
jgi:hypothetical protein